MKFLTGSCVSKREKPFTNGELMKSGLIGKAKEICPKTINLFKTINLSLKTVLEMLRTMTATSITSQKNTQKQKNKTKHFQWSSLALGEFTDNTNTYLYLIRGANTELSD